MALFGATCRIWAALQRRYRRAKQTVANALAYGMTARRAQVAGRPVAKKASPTRSALIHAQA